MEIIKITFKIIMLPIAFNSVEGVIWKFDASDKLILAQGKMVSNLPFKKYDLYIISDEKIKEGDWCIDIKAQNVGQYISVIFKAFKYDINNLAKIVATTDKGLGLPDKYTLDQINLQVPQIPKSFIDDYVEAKNSGNEIIKVDLDMEYIGNEFVDPFNNGYIIKTIKDNCVIINPIKQIFTYNDVAHHIHSVLSAFGVHILEHGSDKGFDSDKWIEKNIK